MGREKGRGFCERNLKPVFALLVLLIAATIAWAVAAGEGTRPGLPLGRAAVASGNSAAERTPAAGRPSKRADLAVDAVSLATPGGGVHFIAQPASAAAPADTSAHMHLAAARPRSRHVFNTVCSLVLPAVVSIHITRSAGGAAGPAGAVRFPEPFAGVARRPLRNGAGENVGSGVVIDSRGFVLTNYHVVAQAAELLVSVCGRWRGDYPAAIVAADPAADLALIRVAGAPPLPEARLGDSHSARVGDWVLAFGTPFGLEQTVTQGIISSRRESLVVDGVCYGQMLQTDAPINRGSSGGPLVNLHAEVVGINTAIYGPGGAFSGTGFAIPVDRAKVFLARNASVFNR